MRLYLFLSSQKPAANMRLKMVGQVVTVGGISTIPFVINSNIFTTGHKLQGMLNDGVIIAPCDYKFKRAIHFFVEFQLCLDFVGVKF